MKPKLKVRIITDRCLTKGQIMVTLYKLNNQYFGWWACRPVDDQGWNGKPSFYLEKELEEVK